MSSRLETNRTREWATPEFHGTRHQTEHEWYELCEMAPSVLLEDSVSTAERLRPRIVARPKHVLVAHSVDLRLRRGEGRREHVAYNIQANAQASCDHYRGALLLARVRQRVSSNIATSRRGVSMER